MKQITDRKGVLLSIFWIIIFTWNNGLGIEVSWWVYLVMILLWCLYLKFDRLSIIILFILFFLNLNVNHLFRIDNYRLDFDVDRINLTYYRYFELLKGYQLENVYIPYRLRLVLYSNWLMIFYWLDSTLKLLSPIFWIKVLGFGGSLIALFGIFKTKSKNLWWILVVCFSSGLGILIDTKSAIFLAFPAIVTIMSDGIQSKQVKKYWWIIVIWLLIDILQK